jgi:hypothetical protein
MAEFIIMAGTALTAPLVVTGIALLVGAYLIGFME